MKKKDFMNEIRKMTIKELIQKRKELKKDLFEWRMKKSANILKKEEISEGKKLRKKIARINTVLRDKIKENGNNR